MSNRNIEDKDAIIRSLKKIIDIKNETIAALKATLAESKPSKWKRFWLQVKDFFTP